MQILGHGVDLVHIPRIARMVDEHGDRFLARCFTEDERAYAAGHRSGAERLAARFAAKEAALKALGTGLRSGIVWTDLSVVRTSEGAPLLHVEGQAAAVARSLGINSWRLSLSHAGEYAMASVIALSD